MLAVGAALMVTGCTPATDAPVGPSVDEFAIAMEQARYLANQRTLEVTHEVIAVTVKAARCEPHALAESKKTWRFPVWVVVGDEPEPYLEMEPQGASRRLLDQLMRACEALAAQGG